VLAENSPERKTVYSSSLLVQAELTAAFLTGAEVDLELIPGSTTIKRVRPFPAGRDPFFLPTQYEVTRVATQQMPNGEDEHLEVFLKKRGEKDEKQYNVYAPSLGVLLLAVFAARSNPPEEIGIDVEFDAEQISSVRLGEPLQ
jgi:hypothetical protein